MSEKKTQLNRGKSSRKHRVGRVTIYLRGKIWYIYYCENGRRVRRRVGLSLGEDKRLAAQANAQLATHTPAILSFQPVSVPDLRHRWLSKNTTGPGSGRSACARKACGRMPGCA